MLSAKHHLRSTHSLLAKWWSVDPLSPPVQFGHDDVLGLVGAGLGREVDDVGLEHLLVQLVQEEVLTTKETCYPWLRMQTQVKHRLRWSYLDHSKYKSF